MRSFDSFGGDYERLIDRSLRWSGKDAAYFAAYKARYLAALMPPRFEGKILDFGCGPGLLASSLGQMLPNSELHGFDESSGMVTAASHLVRSGHFTTDPSELEFDYDLIVVANVLHHVDRERRTDFVRGLCERLRRSGRLVIFEHNPLNPFTRWVVSRCPFDEGVRLLLPAETRKYLKLAGLGDVRTEYIVFFPWRVRRVESALWWCPMGAQYAVRAKRG